MNPAIEMAIRQEDGKAFLDIWTGEDDMLVADKPISDEEYMLLKAAGVTEV